VLGVFVLLTWKLWPYFSGGLARLLAS
jgi:hypothetical protein